MPIEPPPAYNATPSLGTGPVNAAVSGPTYRNQINSLTTLLQTRQKGCLYLKPYTSEGQIDSVQLYIVGRTYIESVLFDLPTKPQVHLSWSKATNPLLL